MESAPNVLTGTVHGKTIELDQAPGLPDGQHVNVTVQPLVESTDRMAAGEGIRRSAGAWAEDGGELDKFLEWNRHQRKTGRPELAE